MYVYIEWYSVTYIQKCTNTDIKYMYTILYIGIEPDYYFEYNGYEICIKCSTHCISITYFITLMHNIYFKIIPMIDAMFLAC